MLNSVHYPDPDIRLKLSKVKTEWRRNTLSLGLTTIVNVARSNKIPSGMKPIVCEVILWAIRRIGPLLTDQFMASCKQRFGLKT